MNPVDLSMTGLDPANMVTEQPAHKERMGLVKMKEMLADLVSRDPSISVENKRMLQDKLKEPGVFDRLMSGATGASLMYVLSKFLKLSKETQMMMSLLGFGVGSILLKGLGKESNKHPDFDPERKAYVVK